MINRYPLIWNEVIARKLSIVIVICFFLVYLCKLYNLKYNWKLPLFTGVGILIASFLIIFSGVIPSEYENFDFSSDTEQRGLLYSWFCQKMESKFDVPVGYSKETANRLLRQFNSYTGVNDINVVVIMNESLSDYSLIPLS